MLIGDYERALILKLNCFVCYEQFAWVKVFFGTNTENCLQLINTDKDPLKFFLIFYQKCVPHPLKKLINLHKFQELSGSLPKKKLKSVKILKTFTHEFDWLKKVISCIYHSIKYP